MILANQINTSKIYLCIVLFLITLWESSALPIVDSGVFVIQGVDTCRRGQGYCLLSRSCSVDKDFVEDDTKGHCDELTRSFTSKLSFVCCKYVNATPIEEYHTTLSTVTIKDEMFQILDENPLPVEDISSIDTQEIPPEDTDNLFEIVGVVTDTTGILDVITRPYTTPTTPMITIATKPHDSSLEPLARTEETAYITAQSPSTTMGSTTTSSTTVTEEDVTVPTSSQDTTTEASQPTTTITYEEEEENITPDTLHVLDLPLDIRNFINEKISELGTNLNNPFPPQNLKIDRIYSEDKVIKIKSNDPEPQTKSSPIYYHSELPGKDYYYSDTEKLETSRPTNRKSNIENFEENRKDSDKIKISNVIPIYQKNKDKYKETQTNEVDNVIVNDHNLFSNKDTKVPNTPDLRVNNNASRPYPVNMNICGMRRASLKASTITKSASTYDWCWSAALMKKSGAPNNFICSGTLVELDLVVTTASCLKRLQGEDLSDYRIVLGDSNLWDEMPYGVHYHNIQDMVTHPDFLTFKGMHSNDIGVIKLADFATLDHNVCLACLSQASARISTGNCAVIGYAEKYGTETIDKGFSRYMMADGMLREVATTLEDSATCASIVQEAVSNPLLSHASQTLLCERKKTIARSCESTFEIGSPLVCKDGGTWYLTGISSWSNQCGRSPTIFTRVSVFSDWIMNIRLRMYGFINYAT